MGGVPAGTTGAVQATARLTFETSVTVGAFGAGGGSATSATVTATARLASARPPSVAVLTVTW